MAELYGKLAGVNPKVSHLRAPSARVMSVGLKAVQPGVSRILYMGSLPDDSFSEKFGPTGLLAEFSVQLATLEAFMCERIADAPQRPVTQ